MRKYTCLLAPATWLPPSTTPVAPRLYPGTTHSVRERRARGDAPWTYAGVFLEARYEKQHQVEPHTEGIPIYRILPLRGWGQLFLVPFAFMFSGNHVSVWQAQQRFCGPKSIRAQASTGLITPCCSLT